MVLGLARMTVESKCGGAAHPEAIPDHESFHRGVLFGHAEVEAAREGRA
eukprot:COSAG01_NODE_19305_length_1018_cov_1.621328_1_plen_48_part_10